MLLAGVSRARRHKQLRNNLDSNLNKDTVLKYDEI
jgi:hypothetical protein